MQELIDAVDPEHEGTVDYEAFITATMDRKKQVGLQNCWAAFCEFDANKDGKISREEFTDAMERETVSLKISLTAVARAGQTSIFVNHWKHLEVGEELRI